MCAIHYEKNPQICCSYTCVRVKLPLSSVLVRLPHASIIVRVAPHWLSICKDFPLFSQISDTTSAVEARNYARNWPIPMDLKYSGGIDNLIILLPIMPKDYCGSTPFLQTEEGGNIRPAVVRFCPSHPAESSVFVAHVGLAEGLIWATAIGLSDFLLFRLPTDCRTKTWRKWVKLTEFCRFFSRGLWSCLIRNQTNYISSSGVRISLSRLSPFAAHFPIEIKWGKRETTTGNRLRLPWRFFSMCINNPTVFSSLLA